MTKTVRIENADNGNAPVRVSKFQRRAGQPDTLVSETRLNSPTQMGELLLTRDVYYVVEKIEGDGPQFRQQLPQANGKTDEPGNGGAQAVVGDVLDTAGNIVNTTAGMLFQNADMARRAPHLWAMTNLQSTAEYAQRYSAAELACIRLNTGCADDGSLRDGVAGQGYVQPGTNAEAEALDRFSASARVQAVKAAPQVPGGYVLDFRKHLAAATGLEGTNGAEVPIVAIRARSWPDFHAGIARYLDSLDRKA